MSAYIGIWDAYSGLECDRIKQAKRLKETLCQTCRQIKTKPKDPSKVEWSVDMELEMGTYAMVLDRVHCPICKLLVGLVEMKTVDAGAELKEKAYRARVMSDPDGPYIQIRTSEGEWGGTFIGSIRLMNPENSVLNPYHQSLKLSGFHSNHVHNSQEQVASQHESPIQSGGPAPFQLLNQWLKTCVAKHGPLCNEPRSRHQKHLNLLLIDAIEGRLVEGNSTLRYFALSYVWGSVQMLQTTMENIEQLKLPGSFRNVNTAPSIPTVIADAMELIVRLGERYLWADCLCIVQNDYAQKHVLIQQMDRVYNDAFASIVAVAGEDAASGLPGICQSPRTPHLLAGFFGHHFVATLEKDDGSLDNVLKTSIYDSRAWTFQERLMSRRCLYFAKHQIYFQCSKLVATDLCLYNPPATGGDNNHLKNVNPLIYCNARNWYSSYVELVQMYTKRRMSYSQDALNAFSGIMSLFETQFEMEFIMGLPRNLIPDCLLWLRWDYSVGLERRSLTGEGNQFPSWCWAGWEGQVKFFLTRPSSAEEQLYICEWQPHHTLESPSRLASAQVSENHMGDELDTSLHRDSRFLAIKSSVVHPSKYRYKEETDDKVGYFITDTSGRICGLIFLECIVALERLNDLDPDYGPLQEFLLVSKLSEASSWLLDLAYAEYGVGHRMDEIYSDVGYCTFLVIEHLLEGKYAERFGMGFVAANAWEQAPPQTKEVILG